MGCLDALSGKDRRTLVSSVYGGRHLFWIGSGFSRNFGYPSWEDVLEEVKTNIEYEGDLPSNYLHAAEILHSFYEQSGDVDEEDFNRQITAALPQDVDVSNVDLGWVESFKALASSTIVTTNWDNVLEQIFDYLPSLVVRGDMGMQVSADRNILKLHGDQSRPKSIVVTQSQYNGFQREDTYLKSKVFTLFAENVPIFLGYSLSDPNIFYIYDEVVSHLGDDRPPSYMLVRPSEAPEENAQKFEQTKLLFAKKNIRLIEGEIEEFLNELESLVGEFRANTDSFLEDHGPILERLRPILKAAVSGKNPKSSDLEEFRMDEGKLAAIEAIANVLEKPEIFERLGGKLHKPAGVISAMQAHSLFQSAIKLGNSMNTRPNRTMHDRIGRQVYENCVNSPFLWDFNEAKIPLVDLISFHLPTGHIYFHDRLDLIKKLLNFGGDELGKCWAIHEDFPNRRNWLRRREIDELVRRVEEDHSNGIPLRNSRWWLRMLQDADRTTDGINERIDTLL